MTTPRPVGIPGCAEPQLLSRAELVAGGVSEYRLRRAVVAGELIAVSPGVYARQELVAADPVTAHRVAVRALLLGRLGRAGTTEQMAVSHVSAAVLHGLRFPGDVPRAVHVTRAPPAKSRAGVLLTVHRRTLDLADVVEVAGVLATSVPRTLIDCVLMLSPTEAMTMVRAGLETGRVDERELHDQLRQHHRVPGMRAAAAAVSAVTGLALRGRGWLSRGYGEPHPGRVGERLDG